MAKPGITVTAEDFETLKSIEAAFSRTLLLQEGAYKAFTKVLRPHEYFNLAAARLNWTLHDRQGPKAKPQAKTKALTGYCDKAVAPLERAFGEAALIAALPAAAHDQRVIDVCRALGAGKLAGLCEKAKAAPKP
jgi:hypothetical protein